MGWNDRMEEWPQTNLPPEATIRTMRVLEIDDRWLEAADSSLKKEAMKAWFMARYCDPANETPYMSSEGGYIWVHGGPYHPEEELVDRFGGKVDDALIDEVVSDLIHNMGPEWAPIHWDDDYDEEFGIDVNDPRSPSVVLERRLNEIALIFSLTGPECAMVLSQRLAYSNVITAFESYLWETMTYAVENDESVVRNIITKLPHFKDQGMKLGQIYDKLESLQPLVKAYLQDTVWHKWDSVATLIAHGLNIKPPPFDAFVKPTIKRHDIIHRSGHDKNGNPITVSIADINELMESVRLFVFALEGDLFMRYMQKSRDQLDALIKSIGNS